MLPPVKSKPEWIDELKRQTRLIAKALDVVGLINIQFAVKDGQVFVILLMAITAAEVAVALAMVVYLWRRKRSLVADEFNGMSG